MTKIQKIIIGVNLLFLMLYTSSFYAEKGQHLAIVVHALFIGYHLCALIFIAVIAHFFGKKEIEKAFWLSLGIVLLIGFGTCVIIYN